MKTPRYLFVVSRQHRELYDLLVERFQNDRKVEVIIDRRVQTHDRRSSTDDLTRRSHLIITRTD